MGSAEGVPAAPVPAQQGRQRLAAAVDLQHPQVQLQPAPVPLEAGRTRSRPPSALAMRLPLLMQQEASGGSGNNTPLSARSVESAWSDSGG